MAQAVGLMKGLVKHLPLELGKPLATQLARGFESEHESPSQGLQKLAKVLGLDWH